MARVIGKLVLPSRSSGGYGGGSYDEEDDFDILGMMARTTALLLIPLLVLATWVLLTAPETETINVMYETTITKTDYVAAHYRHVGKVNRFFPAEYWVCFAYEDKTFCGNNKTIFDRYQFDHIKNIIVSVDVIREIKTKEFVDFENVRIIEDKD